MQPPPKLERNDTFHDMIATAYKAVFAGYHIDVVVAESDVGQTFLLSKPLWPFTIEINPWGEVDGIEAKLFYDYGVAVEQKGRDNLQYLLTDLSQIRELSRMLVQEQAARVIREPVSPIGLEVIYDIPAESPIDTQHLNLYCAIVENYFTGLRSRS